MYKYFLILFLSLSTNANAQSGCDCFERLYRLSNAEMDDQKSLNILRDALTFLSPEQAGEYYYQVAERFRDLKQYDSSAVWYEKAVEWGYNFENLKQNSNDVYNMLDTNKLKAIAFEFRKKIDFNLYDKFIAQETLDQAIRGNELFSKEKYWNNSAPLCERNYIDTVFDRVESSTYLFLKWIFENYGFPTYHDLGFYPSGVGGMILHVTARKNEDANQLLQMLEELSNNCEYMKADILFLKDRQKYYSDNKSYCGLIGAGDRYSYIEDISKADSIRFAYNHIRLKEEASAWDGKLPEDYKPRPYPKNYFCLKKYEIK